MVKTLFQKGVDSTVQWELPICEFFDPAWPAEWKNYSTIDAVARHFWPVSQLHFESKSFG